MTFLKRMAQIPFLPHKIQHQAINSWLHRQFCQAAMGGDLHFLRGRFLTITIQEIDFDLCVTLGKDCPVVIHGDVMPDAVISGPLESFLLLAEQTVDPDTLFFQRKLNVEGDTAFALEVKNLLYRVDWLPESKRLAEKLHAMLNAFSRLSTCLPGQTKSH